MHLALLRREQPPASLVARLERHLGVHKYDLERINYGRTITCGACVGAGAGAGRNFLAILISMGFATGSRATMCVIA